MDMDWDGMYASTKEATNKSEVLEIFQTSASILEFSLSDIVKHYAKKFDPNLKLNKNRSFKNNLDYLKNKGLIDSVLYTNLELLSHMRNKLFHELFTDKTIFDELNKIETDNPFINNLNNGSRKYQMIVSWCSGKLFEISERIAPESIVRIYSVPETKFERIKDPFS